MTDLESHPDRVLIFGGTFDPPHRAHVELPRLVARQRGCGRIIYVPTSSNPLKAEQPTAAAHRLAMLKLALRDCPDCEISVVELEKPGPSFTVDTLERLRESMGPEAELLLLLGADAAATLHRWKQPRRILELATPLIMLRPPWTRQSLRESLAKHWPPQQVDRLLESTVDVPEIDASASALRARLEQGSDAADLIDPAVAGYIRDNRLYSM